MPLLTRKNETLPVEIERDASTGLPLLHEQDGIFRLVLAYLALPYSVVEYGCGKKASLILDYLLSFGLPAYSLNRGLILERDMSPEALQETDPAKRKHALIARNSLYDLGDLRDERLREMLQEWCPGVRIHEDEVHADSYVLHHEPEVQFVIARSHVFAELTFWDADRNEPAHRVIDPALVRTHPFRVEDMRKRLRAPEALIFRAPILGHFRLEPDCLTESQKAAIDAVIGSEENYLELSHERHAALIRSVTGAEPGSIGDPETWTYANNVSSEKLSSSSDDLAPYRRHDTIQLRDSGRGATLRSLTKRMLAERVKQGHQLPSLLAELRQTISDLNLQRITREDARWSENELQILSDVAATMVYFNSLGYIARAVENGDSIIEHLDDEEAVEKLRGIGVRLRRRIDRLAHVSMNEEGSIDARALRPEFVRATIETIRQMNRAGLSVFVDTVGNLHGVLLDPASRERLLSGGASLEDLAPERLSHGSHIDTVSDAGKFDGRLGVLSGVETAHLLRDLHHYYGLSTTSPESRVRLQVSAYIGEEMTFTGQEVAIPGSAAVAGFADPERIYKMENGDGQQWKPLFLDMLRALRDRQENGEIKLINQLSSEDTSDDNALLSRCSHPTQFYTPHSYERHIEQGPVLDKDGVPIALVDTIMGIRQEDFQLQGPQAEAAALSIAGAIRDVAITLDSSGDRVRATVGILEAINTPESSTRREDLCFATRFTLDGELNHAGATPTNQRRDPLVAAARLAEAFRDSLRELAKSERIDLLVGNINALPGTGRNVIPGSVSVSFGIKGRKTLSPSDSDLLHGKLRAFATQTLEREVPAGGEGVRLRRVDPESFLFTATSVRLSLDLRVLDPSVEQDFLGRLKDRIKALEKSFDVNCQRSLEQRLPPQHLERSGQVLIMERSYGGSHTPRETELLADIVRGSALQTAASRQILQHRELPSNFNLFEEIEKRIPDSWLERRPRFISGALHDTSNIARAVRADSSS